MKNIKVKTTVQFNDFLEDVTRYPGDVFMVSEERLNEIYEKGGSWVEVVERLEMTEDDNASEVETDEDDASEKTTKKQSGKKTGKGKA